MGDGDEFDRERADHDPLAETDDIQRDLGRAWLAEPARLDEFRREARQVDGRVKVGPKLNEGPDVVLMRVGDDDPDQILLRLFDEVEIRHDEIDAGQVLAREADAKVDHQPPARIRRPVAVKGAIHANLAQAAERDEHELIVVRHRGSAFRPREKPTRPPAAARQNHARA